LPRCDLVGALDGCTETGGLGGSGSLAFPLVVGVVAVTAAV